MSDIEKLAEQLNTMSIQINFKKGDFRKFFVLAVVANVVGYSIIGSTVVLLNRKEFIQKYKERMTKEETDSE